MMKELKRWLFLLVYGVLALIFSAFIVAFIGIFFFGTGGMVFLWSYVGGGLFWIWFVLSAALVGFRGKLEKKGNSEKEALTKTKIVARIWLGLFIRGSGGCFVLIVLIVGWAILFPDSGVANSILRSIVPFAFFFCYLIWPIWAWYISKARLDNIQKDPPRPIDDTQKAANSP